MGLTLLIRRLLLLPEDRAELDSALALERPAFTELNHRGVTVLDFVGILEHQLRGLADWVLCRLGDAPTRLLRHFLINVVKVVARDFRLDEHAIAAAAPVTLAADAAEETAALVIAALPLEQARAPAFHQATATWLLALVLAAQAAP